MEGKGKALYLGTEMDGKWWKRYRGEGMFARGKGELWLETDGIEFPRELTTKPISIPTDSLKGTKIGRWHSGRWGDGNPVVKVLREKAGTTLSSGFLVSGKTGDAEEISLAIGEKTGK